MSTTARRIARYWAEGHDRSAAAVRGYERQVQDHLDHFGDETYLRQLACWMSLERPDCLDLDMAMRYNGAPRPDVTAHAAHACPCRGGPTRGGGAPAPAIVRQLIRRTRQR
ncbi:hypothetical protein [Streptomyces sp. NPDC006668]|uniref:hypothetical protein n=1 Tax=Streptomyces sp. NPDC006668 TaxID=3156903 RepID=UPI00340F36D7